MRIKYYTTSTRSWDIEKDLGLLYKPVKNYLMAQLWHGLLETDQPPNIRHCELRQFWIRAFLLATRHCSKSSSSQTLNSQVARSLNWAVSKYVDGIRPKPLCWTPSRQASRYTCRYQAQDGLAQCSAYCWNIVYPTPGAITLTVRCNLPAESLITFVSNG